MRVLSIYYTHKPGGFCKRLYRLLNALAAAGHTVQYLSLDLPPAALSLSVRVRKIPFPLRQRSGVLFWALFTAWAPLYLIYACLRFRPQRIGVFGAFYSALFLPTRAFWPARPTLFLRSFVPKINELTHKPYVLRRLSNVIDWLGIRSASKVVFMSNAMQNEVEAFLGVQLSNTAILPNDIPNVSATPVPAPYRAPPLVLFTAGVLDQRKNVALLLKAVSLVQQKLGMQSISLTIAGEGPLLVELKNLSATLGISHCTFLGWIADITADMLKSNLVVHPSLHEGMPNSVLEAVAVGMPVLLSKIPEHREFFPNEELLFDPHNPTDLACKLELLVQSPPALQRTAQLATQAAEKLRFNWDEFAVQHVLR
jgi:glycosyltransferase involved in cell wall biosynthesis